MDGFKFYVEPWRHQRDAFERAKTSNQLALFFEVGTGKTATMINILRWKYGEHKKIRPTLILAPSVVCPNWKREFSVHSKIPQERILVLSGMSGAKRIELLEKWRSRFGVNDPLGSFIVVTNYEMLPQTSYYDALEDFRPEILVCDESHRLKNPNAKSTKKVIKLSDQAEFKYILTGTPILNNPMDIWSQYRILDGGRAFDRNFFVFRSQFFFDANASFRNKQHYFPKWVPKTDKVTQDALDSRISRYACKARKSQCLDLPPHIKQKFEVQLSTEQARAYTMMEKEFVAFVKDGYAMADLVITKALRLQQIASGYLPIEKDNKTSNHVFENTPREEALHLLLEQICAHTFNKVIVWAVFHENYNQIRKICDSLNLRYVEVHGQVDAKTKQESIDSFNKEPGVRVLIGHPGSGGIGVNLVSANYSIFYSRNFSLENDIQAEARNYRGGSEIHDKITRIDLVASGTIDALVEKSLANKLAISERVLRDYTHELE